MLISATSRHNCISISQLSDTGINIIFISSGVITVAHGVASACSRPEGGLHKSSLQNFLFLSSGPVLNIGSQTPEVDDHDVWHRRLRAILEAMRKTHRGGGARSKIFQCQKLEELSVLL